MSVTGVTFDPDLDLDPRKQAFMVEAIDKQGYEFAQAWNIPYVATVLYSPDVLMKLHGDDLARFVANTRLMTVQKKLDVPNALGFHDDIAGVIFSRVKYTGFEDTAVSASHEGREMDGDPTCDIYVPMGNGRSQAKEACDRVEGDVYTVKAEIGPDTMEVPLSSFLLPSAFIPNSSGPWDKLGRLTSWDGMTDGGYEIIRDDATGNETNVFARVGRVGVNGRANLMLKLQREDSRVMRRLRAA